MNVIYFPNLGKSQTGTLIGAKYCADVAIAGITGISVLETRYHDAAGTGINGSAGAFVQVGAALANNISKIQASSTIGEPLAFRLGADAAEAAAGSDLFVLNRGDGPVALDVVIATGAKLWVRSLTVTAVSDGILTLNLMG